MGKLSLEQQQKAQFFYNELETLIKERQAFEALQTDPRYQEFKTDYGFYNHRGLALIHYAAILGDVEKIRELAEKNVSLSQPIKDSKITPLQLAYEYGHKELIDYLCTQVNISDAVRSDIEGKDFQDDYDSRVKEAKFKTLYEKGFFDRRVIPYKPTDPDPYNRSYLNYAAEIGHVEFLKNYFVDCDKKEINEKIRSDLKLVENPLITAAIL